MELQKLTAESYLATLKSESQLGPIKQIFHKIRTIQIHIEQGIVTPRLKGIYEESYCISGINLIVDNEHKLADDFLVITCKVRFGKSHIQYFDIYLSILHNSDFSYRKSKSEGSLVMK